MEVPYRQQPGANFVACRTVAQRGDCHIQCPVDSRHGVAVALHSLSHCAIQLISCASNRGLPVLRRIVLSAASVTSSSSFKAVSEFKKTSHLRSSMWLLKHVLRRVLFSKHSSCNYIFKMTICFLKWRGQSVLVYFKTRRTFTGTTLGGGGGTNSNREYGGC